MIPAGAVLVVAACDVCATRSLLVPIVDSGDGGILLVCGRCASSGAPPVLRLLPKPGTAERMRDIGESLHAMKDPPNPRNL